VQIENIMYGGRKVKVNTLKGSLSRTKRKQTMIAKTVKLGGETEGRERGRARCTFKAVGRTRERSNGRLIARIVLPASPS
jgi:hypothetical protein